MQGLQIGRGLDRDAAPDQRLDIDQFDAQDGDSIGAHAASLAGWRRQQQFAKSVDRMPAGHGVDHVGEICLGIEAIELGALRHGIENGGALLTGFGAKE